MKSAQQLIFVRKIIIKLHGVGEALVSIGQEAQALNALKQLLPTIQTDLSPILTRDEKLKLNQLNDNELNNIASGVAAYNQLLHLLGPVLKRAEEQYLKAYIIERADAIESVNTALSQRGQPSAISSLVKIAIMSRAVAQKDNVTLDTLKVACSALNGISLTILREQHTSTATASTSTTPQSSLNTYSVLGRSRRLDSEKPENTIAGLKLRS